MSYWCDTCYRNESTNEWKSCDKTCPLFGKEIEDIEKMKSTVCFTEDDYEKLKSKVRYLKELAQSVVNNEDSVFADERSVAEYDMREILDVLLNLDI